MRVVFSGAGPWGVYSKAPNLDFSSGAEPAGPDFCDRLNESNEKKAGGISLAGQPSCRGGALDGSLP